MTPALTMFPPDSEVLAVLISSGDKWKLVHEHFSPLATSQPD